MGGGGESASCITVSSHTLGRDPAHSSRCESVGNPPPRSKTIARRCWRAGVRCLDMLGQKWGAPSRHYRGKVRITCDSPPSLFRYANEESARRGTPRSSSSRRARVLRRVMVHIAQAQGESSGPSTAEVLRALAEAFPATEFGSIRRFRSRSRRWSDSASRRTTTTWTIRSSDDGMRRTRESPHAAGKNTVVGGFERGRRWSSPPRSTSRLDTTFWGGIRPA